MTEPPPIPPPVPRHAPSAGQAPPPPAAPPPPSAPPPPAAPPPAVPPSAPPPPAAPFPPDDPGWRPPTAGLRDAGRPRPLPAPPAVRPQRTEGERLRRRRAWTAAACGTAAAAVIAVVAVVVTADGGGEEPAAQPEQPPVVVVPHPSSPPRERDEPPSSGPTGQLPEAHTAPAESSGPALEAPAEPATEQPQQEPEQVVADYFAAINAGDYRLAWDLGGSNFADSYEEFADGFSGTAHDEVEVLDVTGDVVRVRVDATQTDGGHRRFEGAYTVADGVIIAGEVVETG